MSVKKRALLILEDGSIYRGWSFSKDLTTSGEIVFNTGMTGYEEILTDPSYKGQIVSFTYPEIGNTGINNQDSESLVANPNGIIIKSLCKGPSNWRMEENLVVYLDKCNVVEIHGIDTRALTRHLRNQGAMNGIISNQILNIEILERKLKLAPSMVGLNLIPTVSTKYRYEWKSPVDEKWKVLLNDEKYHNLKIIVIDFGVKLNILRHLKSYGCHVIVIPDNTKFEEILANQPDGILLSNGPGDPSTVNYAIKTIRQLIIKKIPIFGICMGHQLLSLALGASTFKLKFGHRGLNHPSGLDKKIEITSQNHGFAVNQTSLKNNDINVIRFNLNDKTLAGIIHKSLPIFSVQYHPEASPGPHDSHYLFKNFLDVVNQLKSYP
nr:carbamoyl-phosphate synthase arginine-specific small subunit [Cavernulicola chilensis]